MSFKTAKIAIEKTINLMKKNKNNHLHIEFVGGEPLMNWLTIESVLKHFGNGKKGIFEISYDIETNASLLTKKMARVFKRYKVGVVISFDSPGNTERILADGSQSIGLIRRSLNILKKNKNWVAFNSVLSKETLRNFDGKGLIDFAKYYGVSAIGLILGLDLEFYKNKKLKKELLQIIRHTCKYAKKRGITCTGYWHQVFEQIIGEKVINLISGFKTCAATGCKLSVEPSGHIFSCKNCSGYLGHISSLSSALDSKKYKEYAMKAYRNAPECNGCEIEGFCSGACMGALEKKYNRINVIDKNCCEIFKKITKILIDNMDANSIPHLFMPKPTNSYCRHPQKVLY